MNYKRIIPRINIKGENVVKTINLEGLKVLGDPNDFSLNYFNEGADEIIFMDVVATLYNRNNLHNIIKKISNNIFIPITVGGGIRSIDDAKILFENGADKVAINTAAIMNPNLITNFIEIFGAQNLVLSIEAKRINKNKWVCFTHTGREKTNIDVIEWIKKTVNLGVGEILLTSIDNEGLSDGFDIDLVKSAGKICKVPLIFGGGLGKLSDIEPVIDYVDGLSISGSFHYKKIKINELRNKVLNYHE